MLRVTGEVGELWWVGDPVALTVPLGSSDGWEWVPEDPFRWWVSVEGFTLNGEAFTPESVRFPAARVVTGRCLRGSTIVAQVTLRPLSLFLVADTWELVVETELSPPTLGHKQEIMRGDTGASLSGFKNGMTPTSPRTLESVLGRLRHGQMAYQGICSANDNGGVINLNFKEGVVYDPV